MKNTIKSIAAYAGITLAAITLNAQAATLSVQVLDKEGKPAADAVVVLTPSTPMPLKALAAPLQITQEKMQFVPAVSIAPVGAKVRFINNDTWDHHVRASAAGLQQFSNTGGFELRLAGKTEGKTGNAAEITFDKAGAIQLGCHLHGSMRGHVFVTDSPFTAKTDAQGQVQFEGVPEGAAQLRVWHADQLIDLPPQTVTLTASPAKASVQLQVVPRRRRI